MPANVATRLPLVDPLDPVLPEYFQNPYPIHKALLEQDRIFQNQRRGWWLFTKHEDAIFCWNDERFKKRLESELSCPFKSARNFAEELSKKWARLMHTSINCDDWFCFQDPPDHTRLRSRVKPSFTSAAIEPLAPYIEQRAHSLLDNLLANGVPCDLMADYALPLSAQVGLGQIGLDASNDVLELSHLVQQFLIGVEPGIDPSHRIDTVVKAMSAKVRPIIDQRKNHTAGDAVSMLLTTDHRGVRLPEHEILSNAVMLFVAGFETVATLITNSVLALLHNPEQLQLLKENPQYIEQAVEELARYDSPVQWSTYYVSEDLEVRGEHLKRGDEVHLLIGAANRDPAAFQDPDRLNILRTDNKHVAFGSGIHYCIGSLLARLEAKIAITALLERAPNLQLANEQLRYKPLFRVRALESLPVVLRPAQGNG